MLVLRVLRDRVQEEAGPEQRARDGDCLSGVGGHGAAVLVALLHPPGERGHAERAAVRAQLAHLLHEWQSRDCQGQGRQRSGEWWVVVGTFSF